LTIPRNPGRLDRLVLAVAVSAHASAAILSDMAALSRQLHTPLLPATHVPVGYGWQNNRLYPSFKVQQLHEQPRVAPSRVSPRDYALLLSLELSPLDVRRLVLEARLPIPYKGIRNPLAQAVL
jgi:hypothetical protein